MVMLTIHGVQAMEHLQLLTIAKGRMELVMEQLLLMV